MGVEDDGSLLLQLYVYKMKIIVYINKHFRPDGTNFSVPKTDCILHRRVARGDVVSFKYDFTSRHAAQDQPSRQVPHDHQQPLLEVYSGNDGGDESERLNLANPRGGALHIHKAPRGIPSNPIVYRIREDMLWEDVVQRSSLPVRRFVNGIPSAKSSSHLDFTNHLIEPHQKIENYTHKPNSYWNYDPGDMRARLEALARAKGFDPLIADNWYNVPSYEFTKHKVNYI